MRSSIYSWTESVLSTGRKGKKAIGSRAALTKEDDGSILLYHRDLKWEPIDPNDPKSAYRRVDHGIRYKIARVTPDNKLTLLKELEGNHIGERNVMHKVWGDWVVLFSDKTRYARNVHHVRMRTPYGRTAIFKFDLPAIEGATVDFDNKTVFSPVQDTIKHTDRKASKGIYEHTRRVLTVMDVLWKMGQLPKPEDISWQDSVRAFDGLTHGLTDEEIAAQATAAFTYAGRRANVSWRTMHWIQDDKGHYQTADMTQQQIRDRNERNYQQIRALAKERLNKFLKDAYGTYKHEEFPMLREAA